jgi:NAD(P)-dependent dehydrogenase (short-subunit alcohol dehydrogenase family)
MTTPNLAGKNALVTGPTSGIGRGTALALAEAGARLILVARNPGKCAEVAKEIVEAGGETRPSGQPTRSSQPDSQFTCSSTTQAS